MSELKLEPGKWYRTREGEKRWCLGKRPDGRFVCAGGAKLSNYWSYFADGRCVMSGGSADIISEWPDLRTEAIAIADEMDALRGDASLSAIVRYDTVSGWAARLRAACEQENGPTSGWAARLRAACEQENG